MSATNLLSGDSIESRFGWPLHKRAEEFAKRLEELGLPTHRVVFEGQPRDFRIIRVPISLPKYRMENGRTISVQEEYLARHPNVRQDLFSGDPELLDAQEAQHRLLLELAADPTANILGAFKDPANRQVDPLLLDEHGFVVNGNRRLAAWRHFLDEDPGRYGHFMNIDVVVLPHCDPTEIDRIEAALQVQQDLKAQYTWDALANMMLQKRRRDRFTDRQLANLYGMKESEVRATIDARNYADVYLRSRGKEHLWSQVSDQEFAFLELVRQRARLASAGDQELFKEVVFSLIDNPDEVGRRLYTAISKAREHLEPIKDQFQARFQVEPASGDTELEELFGGTPAMDGGVDIALANAIQRPENAGDARRAIVEVIESQSRLKEDEKTANFLLNCLAKANGDLAPAIREGLRAETSVQGVQAQITDIRKKLDQIEEWLATRA